MALEAKAHYRSGGIFILDMEALRIVSIPVIPTDNNWNEADTSTWLSFERFTRRHFNGEYFVPLKNSFEFKGKTYFSMGLSEDGYRRIRCVDNPMADPYTLEQASGEESDES